MQLPFGVSQLRIVKADTTDSQGEIPEEHLHAHTLTGVPSDEIPSPWWAYVQKIAGGARQLDIASHVGIDNSHITRWKQGYPPSVQFVTKFARAYGVNVQEALVAAEMITPEEAELRDVIVEDVSRMSTDTLLEELRRRTKG